MTIEQISILLDSLSDCISDPDETFTYLAIDSRKIIFPAESLFFAIRGTRHDGHHYIEELLESGVRNFIIEDEKIFQQLKFEDVNVFRVKNSVEALQKVSAFHRSQFSYPVLAVTGSNGKTIVKEWLFQLMAKNYHIVRSPKSYNSQVGVPLSVWQMRDFHSLGIFEAGISLPGEMEKLENILRPNWGLLTNLGSAHDEGFENREQKLQEKLKLFKNCSLLFYCKDHTEIHQTVLRIYPSLATFTWSAKEEANVQIIQHSCEEGRTHLRIRFDGEDDSYALPFEDEASVENALHCLNVMFYLDIDRDEIRQRLMGLKKVSMRLELKKGINDTYLIDDSYNNDWAGLTLALDFLLQQKHKSSKKVILSDVPESGLPEEELYKNIASLLERNKIEELIGVGPLFCKYKDYYKIKCSFFPDTRSFLNQTNQHSYLSSLSHSVILIKGARLFEFEKVVRKLQQKTHGTILEINLDAMAHNLNFYRSLLKSGAKVMAMVKASAYGSGSTEVANFLQFLRVDYLGVAYADEGVNLREGGVYLPVMVMNSNEEDFEKLLAYDLEPAVYSFRILNDFLDFISNQPQLVKKPAFHLEINTGMQRLGFEMDDIEDLCKSLTKLPAGVRVASIFSHLAGADEEMHNAYSEKQIAEFISGAEKIKKTLGYSPLLHIVNSPGIVRFKEAHLDMVRLGIGLYGIEANQLLQEHLESVGTLKTTISQIKHLKAGTTVGYGRKGLAEREMSIAVLAIGYADGFSRGFSNGNGKVWINGYLCPVIGNVCMDMTMVDVTGVVAKEGDEVIIFGKENSINKLAENIGTIPYELLTNVSDRVKRVFFVG